MKRGLMKGKLMKKLLVFLTALSMMLGIVQTASAYDAGQTGTIFIALMDKDGEIETPLPGVTLAAYKVGNIVNNGGALSFTALEDIVNSGLYKGSPTFQFEMASEAEAAAENLAGVISSLKMQPYQLQASGSDGRLAFSGLEQGMYLITLFNQGSVVKGELTIMPMLISIPYANQETTNGQWTFEVNAFPKLVLIPPKPTITPVPPSPTATPVPGEIVVTKQINYIDEQFNMYPMMATDATYRVGLYLDSEGTTPYGDQPVKEIHIQGSSSGSVSWSNVPNGTYYLFELDEAGNQLSAGKVTIDGEEVNFYNMIVDETGDVNNTIQVDAQNPGRHFYVYNYYYEIPRGYNLVGHINISKKVLVNGETATVNDVFYAGIFREEDGVLDLFNNVMLEQNGTVTVEVPVDMMDGAVIPTEYFVYETDAEGNLLDKDGFKYTVTGETSVTIEREGESKDVEITNSFDEEITPTPVPNEEITPTTPPTNGDDGGANSYTGTTSRTSIRTGDETPIALYVVIILIAAAVIAGVVIRRKKKNSK